MENLNEHRILVGKTGRRSIGRPRHRLKNNIKIYLRGIIWDGVVWAGFVWLRIKDNWRVNINMAVEFVYCYTVHVVELLNYYTNHCTYKKFIKFYTLKH